MVTDIVMNILGRVLRAPKVVHTNNKLSCSLVSCSSVWRLVPTLDLALICKHTRTQSVWEITPDPCFLSSTRDLLLFCSKPPRPRCLLFSLSRIIQTDFEKSETAAHWPRLGSSHPKRNKRWPRYS